MTYPPLVVMTTSSPGSDADTLRGPEGPSSAATPRQERRYLFARFTCWLSRVNCPRTILGHTGAVVVVHPSVDGGERLERLSHSGVIGPEQLFPSRQRLADQTLRLRVSPLTVVHRRKSECPMGRIQAF